MKSGAYYRKIRRNEGRLAKSEIISKLRWSNQRSRRQRILKAQFIDEIKLSRGCKDCGFKEHPAALHFDHLPGTKKLCGVAILRNQGRGSMQQIINEIEKCEVVCANCHAIRTAKRRQND